MLDLIPTEVTNIMKAPTDGVSSSDMLGRSQVKVLLVTRGVDIDDTEGSLGRVVD